ncbi:MAG: hypothetical protein ABIP68_02215 [Ferruginibacter sp.]
MKPFYISLVFVSLLFSTNSFAQPAWTLDPFGREKKPEQYEEKILGSEKTATKKFTIFRKFIQNNVTHYNFYFNANNKLNSVIERAKMAHKDNYTELLSFYPYTLENTVSQQIELDSVIYKATGGILLHDLRNDWIDNLYLLIGKSYYFRKEFDSAAMTFQFINYNLFPRKKNEEENRVVGGNKEVGEAFSIADKENRNFVQKVLTKPASRNESLLWLARTFTEQQQYGQAAGLINILKEDPNLPKRLYASLSEIEAYWFYSQQRYDSAAVYLQQALPNAETKSDKARWEYLLGQLYELSGKGSLASVYYKKSSKHTADPIMDIYARLNDAKLFKEEGNIKELQTSITKLLKMAKRDRYISYRDIIYYSTAKLSVQVPDTTNGIAYFKNSIKYSTEDKGYKSRSYFQLADLAYNTRDYKNASYYYDSINVEDIPKFEVPNYDIVERQKVLKKLVVELLSIEREDSLQLIAAMTPEKRDEYINDLVKKYRKDSGQKTEDNFKGNTLITFNNKNNEQPDLFPTSQKGEWYFYNSSLRTKGFNEFKNKWGKRAKVDNWRTVASSGAGIDNHGMVSSGLTDSLKNLENSKFANTYEGMLAEIPLTPAQIDSSNNRIANNLLSMADIFKFELLDYEQAINVYDIYLQRFPGTDDESEVYLGLYYAYNKLGNKERADYYKNLLTTKFANSTAALKLTNPSSLDPTLKNPAVTKKYLDIYDLFIEGKFEEAINKKKAADSSYGKNYWTPQLLYIEAIYHIKERDDSSANRLLNNISVLYPNTQMQEKAITLMDVLSRRSEIENYLTNLDIKREEEKKLVNIIDTSATEKVKEISKPVKENNADSVKVAPIIKDKVFSINPESPHVVLMVLNKVDGVYQQEAKNSFTRYNREMFYSAGIKINKEALDNERVLLEFSPFNNADDAIKYLDKIKRAAPSEVSWLPASKYSFIIISVENLQILKENKDFERYKALLNTKYNNRF